jgi:hypothetical protein
MILNNHIKINRLITLKMVIKMILNIHKKINKIKVLKLI